MKRFWPWLRLLLALGILAALGFRLGTRAFVDGLRAIDASSVLAALGIGLLTTVFSAWRWCVIARRLGLPLSLRAAVSDYYRALLLNAVLPAGVLGDVHRAVDHGRQSGDVGRGVRVVVFERFAGQAVLVAAGIAVVFTQSTLPVDLAPSTGATLTTLIVLAAAAVFVAKNGRARRAALATWADARVGLFSREALPQIVFLSAATLAGHVALFLVAAKVAGSTASPGQLFPLIVLTLLVMAVPINVGGFGPREAFLAVAFNAAGLGAAQGLTTGVVYGVLAMIAALPGVFVLFRKRKLAVEHHEVLRESAGERREKVLALAG